MNSIDKKVYSEVYSIIKLLGKEYRDKLPQKLISHLKRNRLIGYNPHYDFEKDLYTQEIQKESIALLAVINYRYWTENNKEKQEIFSMLKKKQN